ncbi:MAG TPA: hypothetical protein VFJ18_11935, partial [Pararhizobium sp.]|nr:hypothetical protein [Pararhizobium sp.]
MRLLDKGRKEGSRPGNKRSGIAFERGLFGPYGTGHRRIQYLGPRFAGGDKREDNKAGSAGTGGRTGARIGDGFAASFTPGCARAAGEGGCSPRLGEPAHVPFSQLSPD